MSRIIRLPAVPIGQYRNRRTRIRGLGLCASLAVLASCTTFGTNIKGSFACGAAEGGACAPASVIDDRALAEITGESDFRPAGPYQAQPRTMMPQQITYRGPGQAPAVTPAKVLRIVFPAHVDGAGRYHETSIVQAVVDNGQWLAATDNHGPELAATNTLNVEPDILSKLGGASQVSNAGVSTSTAVSSISAVSASDPAAPSIAMVRAARSKAHARRPSRSSRTASVTRIRSVETPTGTASVTSVATVTVHKGNEAGFDTQVATTAAKNRPAAFNPHVED